MPSPRGLVMALAGLLLVAVAVVTTVAAGGAAIPLAVIGIVFIAVGARQRRNASRPR